eukprot:gene2224-2366_t
MPSRHSKNSGDKHHFTYHEKQKSGLGTIKQRLGSESQLPFGYCALSLHPAEDAVVSPSGHLYSRESILEYLLTKSKELKTQREQYEQQQARQKAEEQVKEIEKQNALIESFVAANDGMGGDSSSIGKRKADDTPTENESSARRRKLIDETAYEIRLEQLKKVSPWIPQFTPEAKESLIPEPPKRPLSPFSKQPLRSKDLIPIKLVRETTAESLDTNVRYICPVTRKTITNQKLYFIKKTGALMIEQAAEELAFPTMTCPLTGRSFTRDDVIELARATSGFAATGNVEAKKERPNLN